LKPHQLPSVGEYSDLTMLSSLNLLPFLYLLSLTSASSSPPPTAYTATVHHLLPSSKAPLPLASLSYNPAYPEQATLLSFTPPRAPTSANSTELTRVAVAIDSEPRYRTTLTSLASFHPPYKGRFRLIVTRSGEVLGVSWHATVTTTGAGDISTAGNRGTKGEFDLLVEKQGPRPVLEKFVVKGQPTVNEEGEEVVEKTLFQRYWWVLVGVAFLALSGGGGE